MDSIYQVGGAQGVAALAFGTETIPKVDKITGPGNIFVATAKKQVYGIVGIDMIAGPSEIGVIADSSANPTYVAADLLSQAEHDTRARAILVTDSQAWLMELKVRLNDNSSFCHVKRLRVHLSKITAELLLPMIQMLCLNS